MRINIFGYMKPSGSRLLIYCGINQWSSISRALFRSLTTVGAIIGLGGVKVSVAFALGVSAMTAAIVVCGSPGSAGSNLCASLRQSFSRSHPALRSR